MCKKIVLIDASPRTGGNSEVIVDILSKELADCGITVFKLREKTCNPCLACNECFDSGKISCSQDDDMAKLLPKLEEADGIVLTGPIYFGSISAQSKTVIDRFYAFFNPAKGGMTKTAKFGKKAAMLFCCGAGPADKYKEQLAYLISGFAVLGANTLKNEVFGGLMAPGAINERPEYIAKVKEIADWLKA